MLQEKVRTSCWVAIAAGLIASPAIAQEFTPPVIFSDVERTKLVFKVEARLEGRARELPLARDDGRHGDDMVGVRRVAEAEQEPEDCG